MKLASREGNQLLVHNASYMWRLWVIKTQLKSTFEVFPLLKYFNFNAAEIVEKWYINGSVLKIELQVAERILLKNVVWHFL